jgi:hypothetical protein
MIPLYGETMFTQGGANNMNKILATLAGTVALALGAGACSAVDTQEAKSIAPIAAQSTSVVTPAVHQNFDRYDYYGRPNRSVTRPVKPGLSAHENHVRLVNAANRAARAEAAAQAKLAREKAAAKAKATRIANAKAAKAKLAKKKVVKHKTVVKKTKKVITKTHRAPGGIAACIRKYESDGNYRAQNGHTSASGAYQFVDGTWHAVTGLSGHAKDYSPATQDAAFYKLWNGGRGAGNWVTAHKCGY